MIDIDAVLDQVRATSDQVATAVEAVFGFTLAAGVLVLGVWPKPLIDLMEPSIAQLAAQLAATKL